MRGAKKHKKALEDKRGAQTGIKGAQEDKKGT